MNKIFQINQKFLIVFIGSLFLIIFLYSLSSLLFVGKNKSDNLNYKQTQNHFYKIVRVIDGDTVIIEINGRNETVRLIGINTPETVDHRRSVECFGAEA